ncbi:MAG: sensor histidine kinase [Rhodospirillaceae bacterium]|nr:sensor histidine kinase [Rhodospirillaceae bacterium]|tara:strand:+ start:2424 stop:3818 length:1395 start_codon:yes stop_codon:yes gene_type:complete
MAGSRIDMPGFWRGLSARLVVLTIIFVMVAEVLIFVPSISRFRVDYLQEAIDAAYQATLTVRAAPDGRVTPELKAELLDYIGIQSVGLKLESVSYLMLGMPEPVEVAYNLSDQSVPVLIIDVFRTLAGPDDGIIRIAGQPRAVATDAWIELTMASGPLKSAMIDFSWRILGLSIFISVITAGLVFFALQRMMVRPVQRLTEDLIAFREAPEDVSRTIEITNRSDEIGIAQRELAEMERGLRQSLRQRTRLAAVGSAVSKISHDLRNILATAALVSDRLSMSGDPEVQRQAPVVLAAIDRAVKLCQDTLRYARADEPDLHFNRFELAPLIDDVSNALVGSGMTAASYRNAVDAAVVVHADRDQMFRVLFNLSRNAAEAMGDEGGSITVEVGRIEGGVTIDLTDTGPGIPARVQAELFEAFAEGAKGTGLGLAISRELTRAHGGDLTLIRSDETGTRFRISLPDRA